MYRTRASIKICFDPKHSSSNMILKTEFYERDTLIVAKELIGKFLVHETKEGITIGKIAETETYVGPEDKASHAYNNLRTRRTEVQFGPKGHAYIYQIYGMYFCFDVTSGKLVGKPEAILVRALEPMEGLEIMMRRRVVPAGQIANLTNGPSKLCMAMGISRKQNGADLCVSPLHIETGATIYEKQMIQTTRVNVDYAGEWKRMPWRFLERNSSFVSKQARQ